MVLLIGCVLAVGCKPKDAPDGSDAEAVERIPVETIAASTRTVMEQVRGESTLIPLAEVRVLSESSGRIVALDAEVGDHVTAGQLIATVENKDLVLQMQHARDTLSLQSKEVDASRPLYDDGFLSRQAFEQLELSRAQAQNALARLQTQSAEQRIRAAIAGVILQRDVERGQQVTVGSQLFVLADVSHLRVRIPIPEKSLRVVRVGQNATIELSGLQNAAVPATVTRILPAVDATSGTVTIELTLASTQLEDDTPLLPGMYARVRIDTRERQDVLVVPRTTLVEEGGETSLFVVVRSAGAAPTAAADVPTPSAAATPEAATPVIDSASLARAELRSVETGWEGDGYVEILSGLSPNEEVVRIGQHRLRDSSLVRVVESAP